MKLFPLPREALQGGVQDTWGAGRSQGRTHEGVDLFAPRGTPVFAPIAGVARQLEGPIGGLQVTIDDGHERITLSHLDAFAPGPGRPGGRVEIGDVVGYVGDTGTARGTGPHLHLEQRLAGQKVNPYNELKRLFANATEELPSALQASDPWTALVIIVALALAFGRGRRGGQAK